jgi:hypothetical protein
MMHKEYCRKHGIEYRYYCPECARERELEQQDRATKREERKQKWDEMVEKTVWLPEVSNPTLLNVKMFLADVIHKINMPYDYDEHNCAHFSKEIQDVATELGIRCGYVVISFENSDIGHAIIAFETDYGLKFFEPQSADEEDVIVGRCYSAHTKGVLQGNIISRIEIAWNDGAKIVIDK